MRVCVLISRRGTSSVSGRLTAAWIGGERDFKDSEDMLHATTASVQNSLSMLLFIPAWFSETCTSTFLSVKVTRCDSWPPFVVTVQFLLSVTRTEQGQRRRKKKTEIVCLNIVIVLTVWLSSVTSPERLWRLRGLSVGWFT